MLLKRKKLSFFLRLSRNKSDSHVISHNHVFFLADNGFSVPKNLNFHVFLRHFLRLVPLFLLEPLIHSNISVIFSQISCETPDFPHVSVAHHPRSLLNLLAVFKTRILCEKHAFLRADELFRRSFAQQRILRRR